MRSLLTLVVLAATWQLLSGKTKPLILGFGVVSCLFVFILMRRMNRFDGHSVEYRLGTRPLQYFFWLLGEIVKANLHLARVILTPRMPLSESLLHIDAKAQTELGQVIFGNSITLTPGTTTLDVRDGSLLVHSLTKDCTEDVLSGRMNEKCAWLEGEELAKSDANSSTTPGEGSAS